MNKSCGAIVGGLWFVVGFLLISSDGPYFPFINLIGVVILITLVPICNKFFPIDRR